LDERRTTNASAADLSSFVIRLIDKHTSDGMLVIRVHLT